MPEEEEEEEEEEVIIIILLLLMMKIMKQAVFIIFLHKLKSNKVLIDHLCSVLGEMFFSSIISSSLYITIGEAKSKAGSLSNTFTIFKVIYCLFFLQY